MKNEFLDEIWLVLERLAARFGYDLYQKVHRQEAKPRIRHAT
jgi:hypothetical protein